MAEVIVGVPTLNEESTIARTVRCVDEGLRRLNRPALIINCDSRSKDDTVARFHQVPTWSGKEALTTTTSRQGKGANIRRVIRRAAELNAEAVLFIDADLRTLEPWWIPELAGAVLAGRVDYGSASYRASQGGPLRHLISRPVVYGLFGADIAQPTGGEVALSGRMTRRIDELDLEDSDLGYGIDILLACEAASERLPFAVVDLGAKVHRARRWSTIDDIAVEVVESALRAYRRHRFRGRMSSVVQRPVESPAQTVGVTPPKRRAIVDVDALRLRWVAERDRFERLYADVLPPYLADAVGADPRLGIDNRRWVEIVATFARESLSGAYRERELAAALMPPFLGRMASFAEELGTQDADTLTRRFGEDLDHCLESSLP
ncbi:glycosyltransferase [Actinoallomurus acanthiterrae]